MLKYRSRGLCLWFITSVAFMYAAFIKDKVITSAGARSAHNGIDLDSYCHFEPQWEPSVYDECRTVTEWTPQSNAWASKFLDEHNRPIGLKADEADKDHSQEMADCVRDGRFAMETLQEMKLLPNPFAPDFFDGDNGADEEDDPLESWGLETLRVVSHHVNQSGTVVMVEVENALPPNFANAVEVLAACTRKHLVETNFRHNGFDYGGNDCTYLANLMQLYLPGVAARIQSVGEFAAEWAGWSADMTPVGKCGLRTSEWLQYGTFDERSLAPHEDGGSLYTVLFAMADADAYSGGHFYVLDEDNKKEKHFRIKPEKYSAVVFLSETLHGVESVDSGDRVMFANEFWELSDTPYPFGRPDRNDARFELFLRNDGTPPSDKQLMEFCLKEGRDIDDCFEMEEDDRESNESDEEEEDL